MAIISMDTGDVMKFKKWDFQYFSEQDWWWGFVHYTGSALITGLLYRLTGMILISMIITIGLGIIWECLDGVMNGKYVFDPAGFSWRDLIYDTIGIITAGLILLTLTI